MTHGPFSEDEINDLYRKERDHVWHPFTQMKTFDEDENLMMVEGEGFVLRDVHGREYLDGVSSIWVTVHGHCHPHIVKAVNEQLKRLDFSTMLGVSHPRAADLADKLSNMTPGDLNRVFYSDNGSTSVEIAMKIAYQHHLQKDPMDDGRTRFVSLGNAYHGDTLGAVGVGGIDIFHEKYGPIIHPSLKIPSPYCYRCPLGLTHPECGLECARQLDDLLEREGDSVAAVVIEPIVQGAGGMITAPEGHLGMVAKISRDHNVPLIADEVATGFGKTGRMFACQHEDVTPDIMCLAKSLSGGVYPLAATMVSERIYNSFLGQYDQFRSFFHGHTFTGSPVGCAAALANLELYDMEATMSKLPGKIRFLEEKLESLMKHQNVGEVRQRGFMIGVELVKDRESKQPFDPTLRMGHRICMRARDRGVLIRPLGDVVVLMPPLGMSTDDLGTLVDAVDGSLRDEFS